MCDCENNDIRHEKCCVGRMKPYTFVSNASDGYLQTKEGIYYKGVSFEKGEPGEKIYFAIENPEYSCKNIIINKITVANLGDVTLLCSLVLCGKPCKKMQSAISTVNTNGRFCRIEPCGIILHDKCMNIDGGKIAESFVVKSSENETREIDGSILIPPCKFCILEISAFPSGCAKAACSFEWWEETCR